MKQVLLTAFLSIVAIVAVAVAQDRPHKAYGKIGTATTAAWLTQSVTIPAGGRYMLEVIADGAAGDTLGVAFGNDTTGTQIIWIDINDPAFKVTDCEAGFIRLKSKGAAAVEYKLRAVW
jgi:Flp pilus assembly pilin Flp